LQQLEFKLANGSALVKRLRRVPLFKWIPRDVAHQSALVIAITWAPLLIFTAINGVAASDKVRIPFLADLVQYARFLVAVPCVIGLGEYINPRLEKALNNFLKSRIISDQDVATFADAVSRAQALASSTNVELAILAVVYSYSSLGLQREIATGLSSWNRPHVGGFIGDSVAGWWFLWVSMPLFLFGWFLWLWRLGVWSYLLYRISRLNLRLIATHPDRTGGLTFLHVAMRRFCVLVFGISSILSASIGEEILFNGARLRSFELELVLLFGVCVAVILGPLVVFTPVLIRAKLDYWGKFGPVATTYVQEFDGRWISRTDYPRESILGTPDIQSLADLGHSFGMIGEMRTVLVNKTTLALFALAYVVPVLPLLTSVISVRQLLSEIYTHLLK
jgi:hypothetical protein